MKQPLLLFFLLTLGLNTFAQKRQNVYFFKDDQPATDVKNIDFRRIIQEPDSGSTLYNLFEFYPDDVQKTEGKVSQFEPNLVYEGIVKSYNKKGVLIEKSNYTKGRLLGESSSFYPNGKLKEVTIYTQPPSKDQFSSKLVSFYDSLGNQTVKDGTGYYKVESEDRSEEGNYVNSNKDGIWKGKANDATFEELFKDGKFISGESKTKDGKIFKYKREGDPPSYPGGIDEFYQYLGREITFSREALRAGLKGKLYISFVIDKDGSLTNIKFENSVGFGVEEEALRVFSASRKWHPGLQHGIPVKVKYNINLNLSSN